MSRTCTHQMSHRQGQGFIISNSSVVGEGIREYCINMHQQCGIVIVLTLVSKLLNYSNNIINLSELKMCVCISLLQRRIIRIINSKYDHGQCTRCMDNLDHSSHTSYSNVSGCHCKSMNMQNGMSLLSVFKQDTYKTMEIIFTIRT